MKTLCVVFFINVLQYVSSDDSSNQIKLLVGGVEVNLEYEMVAQYDGAYEYLYEDGEALDLTCRNIHLAGGLKLGYYDAHGTKVVETDILEDPTELSFRLLMRAEYNRSYVDCIYIPLDLLIDHKQEYTYRIVFRQQNSRSDFIVTIDGVKLGPVPYKDSEYHYKFIYGETLNITCEKGNKQLPGNISTGVNISKSMLEQANESKEYVKIRVIEENQARYIFLLDTKYMDDGSMQCSSGNLDSEDFISAKVHFFGDSRDPVIRGLSPSNIIYEYSKNKDEWVTHYHYSLNETLPLTCSTVQQKTTHWFPEDNTSNDSKFHSYGYSYINRTFTLNADHNGTNITCEATCEQQTRKAQRNSKNCETQRMVVILHPKSSISYSDDDDDRSNLYLIIGCVVSVLFVGVTSVCAYCWCKKNKNDNTTKEEPYENFNEDNNPIPLPIPNQWDENEYTYIKNENNYIDNSVIIENDLYHRNKDYNVSQKRITACSGHTENHYSEIDENIFKNPPNNTNYSEPYDHVVNWKRDIPSSGESYSNTQKETNNKGYGNLAEKNKANMNYCNIQEDDNDNDNLTYVNNHKYSN